MNRLTWRKLVNGVMLTLTGVCTVLTVSVLFVILGCLIYHGGSSLELEFLHQAARARRRSRRRHGQRDRGQPRKSSAWRRSSASRSDFFAGVYLSEFEDKKFAPIVRYVADLLNGVPSIVVGILAWTLVVLPMHGNSGIAGSIALSVMLIPIVTRQTEQFLREVPLSLREGALALGASKWKMIATVVVPAGSKGILTGMILGVARISGESAPLLFTALGNQFWGGLSRADRLAAGDDLQVRHFAFRRLAPAGVGGRPGSDRHGSDCEYSCPPGIGKRSIRSTWLTPRRK